MSKTKDEPPWGDEYYTGTICKSEGELNAYLHFDRQEFGFEYYRQQIAAPEIWPMAILGELEVPPDLRRQGIGTAAIQEFLATARRKGARLAFLQVGWDGELSDRDNTVSWYQRRGWRLLRMPPTSEVPYMYQPL
jgi:GNAT superfamily N-acetyltransferase